MLNSQGTAPVQATAAAEHLTFAWFAKRSALWAFIVALGIGAACGLYAVAGEPDALEPGAATAPGQSAQGSPQGSQPARAKPSG